MSFAALVLFRTPESLEILRLRHELAEARRQLTARERLLSELRDQIVSFEGRYMRQVGILYRRLDEWEAKLAELHGKLPPAQEPEAADDTLETAPVPADPGALKLLYRDLVKLIHPDFAADAADEARRTRLMAQANDAFRRDDAAALRRMLNGYDPAVVLNSAGAVREEVTRLMALLFQVTQDVEAVDLQIEELQASDSARLRLRAFEAARQGRDILAEMAARVNGSIGLAMRRYELDLTRVARPANGPSVASLVTAETSRT